MLIRQPEPLPQSVESQNLWHDIWDGLQLTFTNWILRTFCLEATTYNFFNQAFATIFILYATRKIHLTAATIGFLFAIGSVGALIGSVTANRIERRIGVGLTMSVGAVVSCVAPTLIRLAPALNPVPLLICGFFATGLSVTITNVHVFSMRQAIMDPNKRGRMIASYRFVSWGVIPFGALFSGLLASSIGLQPTLLVGAFGVMTACLWFILSPLPSLRHIPPQMRAYESEATFPEKC